jgi:hypothetical protein
VRKPFICLCARERARAEADESRRNPGAILAVLKLGAAFAASSAAKIRVQIANSRGKTRGAMPENGAEPRENE